MSCGILIALSGIDGAGKSTQATAIMQYGQAHALQPVYLWSRGGYTSGFNAVKQLLRRLSGPRLPASGHSAERSRYLGNPRVQTLWLTIALLDMARVYALQVRWWLVRGRLVLCDRYLWDTLIDFRLAFPQVHVESWLLWKLLVRLAPRPDVALLLMIPLEESARRCEIKYEPFPDPPEVRRERFACYQKLVGQGKFRIIDATRPVETVTGEILDILAAWRK
jgi:thymidylate kinase